MNGLLRRWGHASRSIRVLRAQRSSQPQMVLSARMRRPYSTGNEVQGSKFDRLCATLRPGMKEDELALTIAALLSSTKDLTKLDKLVTIIPPYTKGLNRRLLYEKVNHYVSNPSEERFEALLSQSSEQVKERGENGEATSASQPTASSQQLEQRSPNGASVPQDVSPLDQLTMHMARPEVQRALEDLGPAELQEFQEMSRRLFTESGDENMTVLDRYAEILAKHGVPISYTNRPQAPDAEAIDYLTEFKQHCLTDVSEEEAKEMLDEATSLVKSITAQRPAKDLEQPIVKEVVSESVTAETTTEQMPSTQTEAARDPYPDLMTPDPLLDSRDVMEFPPTRENPYHNRVIIRNNASIFHESMLQNGYNFGEHEFTETDEVQEQMSSEANLPLPQSQLRQLYRFPLIKRRITQQTGKGKIHRQFVLMVVGNGDGLVGYGQGKDEDAPRAEAKAYAQAVRNMDWVERFEKRTIWSDMEAKLGATQIIMRPRPVGFGLRCNPNLHQVLKAAGIKDVSAKVWGSRNPINVIKTAFRMLQAGHAPLGMGDGVGGPGKKLNKGSGLRSKEDVERERGRKLVSLRK